MSIETTKQMSDQSYTHINLEYLEMMSDGDDSMKKVMLEMLLEELPQELDKMSQLTTQGDWDELCSVSHKMKSTLAFVGNPAMTESNSTIELISKSKQEVNQITALMQVLNENAPNALSELRIEFDKL